MIKEEVICSGLETIKHTLEDIRTTGETLGVLSEVVKLVDHLSEVAEDLRWEKRMVQEAAARLDTEAQRAATTQAEEA